VYTFIYAIDCGWHHKKIFKSEVNGYSCYMIHVLTQPRAIATADSARKEVGTYLKREENGKC